MSAAEFGGLESMTRWLGRRRPDQAMPRSVASVTTRAPSSPEAANDHGDPEFHKKGDPAGAAPYRRRQQVEQVE
jgi:hypothetical protein